MSSGSVYHKKTKIVTRLIAGEMLLVPIGNKPDDFQTIYALNPVGQYIWQQLDGERSLTEIQDGIVAEFDVDKGQAKTDLQEFISQLVDADMIEKKD